MKQIMHDQEFMRYQKDEMVFSLLLIGSPIISTPLILYLDGYGIAISCLILAVALFYALRIEKFKKKHNLRTYRQLVAYEQGRSLSEIEEAEERGKAPYQRILLPILFGLGIGAITLLISWFLLTFFPIK